MLSVTKVLVQLSRKRMTADRNASYLGMCSMCQQLTFVGQLPAKHFHMSKQKLEVVLMEVTGTSTHGYTAQATTQSGQCVCVQTGQRSAWQDVPLAVHEKTTCSNHQ